MGRHVEDIKNMIFDEPNFDNDEEEIRIKKKDVKKSSVETIVFRDPAKKRKLPKVRQKNVSDFCKFIFAISRNPKYQFRYLNQKNLILKKLVLMYINLVLKVLKKVNMKMLVLH
jgi:hypothetical protein